MSEQLGDPFTVIPFFALADLVAVCSAREAQAAARLATAEADLEAARDALRPFAAAGQALTCVGNDDATPVWLEPDSDEDRSTWTGLTLGHFRDARRVYGPAK